MALLWSTSISMGVHQYVLGSDLTTEHGFLFLFVALWAVMVCYCLWNGWRFAREMYAASLLLLYIWIALYRDQLHVLEVFRLAVCVPLEIWVLARLFEPATDAWFRSNAR